MLELHGHLSLKLCPKNQFAQILIWIWMSLLLQTLAEECKWYQPQYSYDEEKRIQCMHTNRTM